MDPTKTFFSQSKSAKGGTAAWCFHQVWRLSGDVRPVFAARGWRCWAPTKASDANALGAFVESRAGSHPPVVFHHMLPPQVLLQVQPGNCCWEPSVGQVDGGMRAFSCESLLHWDWDLAWAIPPGVSGPCWWSSLSSQSVSFFEISLEGWYLPVVWSQHPRRCSIWRLFAWSDMAPDCVSVGPLGTRYSTANGLDSRRWPPWLLEVGPDAYDSTRMCQKFLREHYLHALWPNADVCGSAWSWQEKGTMSRCCLWAHLELGWLALVKVFEIWKNSAQRTCNGSTTGTSQIQTAKLLILRCGSSGF